jgi:hypothetical protein
MIGNVLHACTYCQGAKFWPVAFGGLALHVWQGPWLMNRLKNGLKRGMGKSIHKFF